jgi:membrane-bound lytic murein transglycosylase D
MKDNNFAPFCYLILSTLFLGWDLFPKLNLGNRLLFGRYHSSKANLGSIVQSLRPRLNNGRRFVLILFLTFGSLNAHAAQDRLGPFTVPPILEPNVKFWVDVFTKYSKDQAIIHDMDNPLRIYSIVDVKGLSPDIEKERKKRESKIQTERERIRAILKRLGEPSRQDTALSPDENVILRMFDKKSRPEIFMNAAERIRSQSGLRESFMEGLVRSGRYIDRIRKIFQEYGIPEDLVYLPHVESSYNWRAVSKAGAVGVWQFTNSTGKLFLKITDAIDERKDPLLAAEAAARLLNRNFEATGKWPLAVTAYNHGLLSIRNAMRDLDTDDLMHIIMTYEYKPFGFASKNFYAEFLAAIQVAKNSSKYYGDIRIDPPLEFKTFTLPVPLKIDALERAFGLVADTLQAFNLSFLSPILRGARDIPMGYPLRIPAETNFMTVYEILTSEGFLPRGAYRAWCEGAEKKLFHFVETSTGGRNASEPSL